MRRRFRTHPAALAAYPSRSGDAYATPAVPLSPPVSLAGAPVSADIPAGRPALTVVERYGDVLTLPELLAVLKMSRTTAKRRLMAGTFPIAPLPRVGQQPYRFASTRVDRYLSRAEHGVSFSMRRAG